MTSPTATTRSALAPSPTVAMTSALAVRALKPTQPGSPLASRARTSKAAAGAPTTSGVAGAPTTSGVAGAPTTSGVAGGPTTSAAAGPAATVSAAPGGTRGVPQAATARARAIGTDGFTGRRVRVMAWTMDARRRAKRKRRRAFRVALGDAPL
ncbi:MAG: hypothetical protein U1F43_26165 [Myxococcota bacterium]